MQHWSMLIFFLAFLPAFPPLFDPSAYCGSIVQAKSGRVGIPWMRSRNSADLGRSRRRTLSTLLPSLPAAKRVKNSMQDFAGHAGVTGIQAGAAGARSRCNPLVERFARRRQVSWMDGVYAISSQRWLSLTAWPPSPAIRRRSRSCHRALMNTLRWATPFRLSSRSSARYVSLCTSRSSEFSHKVRCSCRQDLH